MPIELRTGLPGAGKTLGAVEQLIHLRKVSPDRPLYAHGIADLRDGLAIPLDAEGVRNWKQLPPGSILFVDEVQKLMPAKRGAIDSPQWVRDLSEHRHLGLDFVFITQHPSLIDAYVRKLVDRHIHTVRVFGTKMVERWSWPICQADPNSKGAKKDAESKTRHMYSKEAMASYTSAELHTVKRSVPRFVFVAVALVLALPLLGWVGYKAMNYANKKAAGENAPVASASGVGGSSGQGKEPMSKEDWVKQQVPRVAGLPWSAPIFDGAKVQAQPDLYCVAFGGEHGDDDCLCQTEQGTRATVPEAMCMAFAKGGVYNPYRQSVRQVSPATGSAAPFQGESLAGSASPQASQNGTAPDLGGPYSSGAVGNAGTSTGPMPRGPYRPPEYMSPNR
jgi:zona occludens toxin